VFLLNGASGAVHGGWRFRGINHAVPVPASPAAPRAAAPALPELELSDIPARREAQRQQALYEQAEALRRAADQAENGGPDGMFEPGPEDREYWSCRREAQYARIRANSGPVAEWNARITDVLRPFLGPEGSVWEGILRFGPLAGAYIGNTVRIQGNRALSDLPGGQRAALGRFEQLTGGNYHIDPNTGDLVGSNGVRLRTGRDDRARIDIPANSVGSNPLHETIHFNP
jgi:hypothetical protein